MEAEPKKVCKSKRRKKIDPNAPTTETESNELDEEEEVKFNIDKETGLKVVLWFLLLFVASRYGWGIVYFIASTLFIIFVNLGQRRKGELSAYHVFNRNFEKLPGSLDASQFEKEITHQF